MFSMCESARGVSRGQTTSLLRSLSATSAARTSRLSAVEFAIFPRVFIEHGRTAIAPKLKEPLAGGAPKSPMPHILSVPRSAPLPSCEIIALSKSANGVSWARIFFAASVGMQ